MKKIRKIRILDLCS